MPIEEVRKARTWGLQKSRQRSITATRTQRRKAQWRAWHRFLPGMEERIAKMRDASLKAKDSRHRCGNAPAAPTPDGTTPNGRRRS